MSLRGAQRRSNLRSTNTKIEHRLHGLRRFSLIFVTELNETFEKCAKITETIGNFLNVIPAKAGIHDVLLWIPDISLREIPE